MSVTKALSCMCMHGVQMQPIWLRVTELLCERASYGHECTTGLQEKFMDIFAIFFFLINSYKLGCLITLVTF